jgi:hypothetical protein
MIFHTKFHMSSSNSSLVMAFRKILEKFLPTKATHFSKTQYLTVHQIHTTESVMLLSPKIGQQVPSWNVWIYMHTHMHTTHTAQ